MQNIYLLGLLSVVFIAIFVYYNVHQDHIKVHWFGFIQRVVSIYIISLLVLALLLTLIQVTPWETDFMLALRRVILVSFPASMSGVVADMLK